MYSLSLGVKGLKREMSKVEHWTCIPGVVGSGPT